MPHERPERGWVTVLVACSAGAAVALALANVATLAHGREVARLSDLRMLADLRARLDALDVRLLPALPEIVHAFFRLHATAPLMEFAALAVLTYLALAAPFVLLALLLAAPFIRARSHDGEAWPLGLPFAVGAAVLVPIVAHRLSLLNALGPLTITGVSLLVAFSAWWLATRLVRSRAVIRGLVGMATVVALGGGAFALFGTAYFALAPRPAELARPLPPPDTPNVLLVSIDTLRPDHLGSYGYRRDTSPTIDALAAEGARFATVVSPTSWTLPAHMTLLTALPPEIHGVVEDRFRLGTDVTTLAEVLRDRGFATAGFVSGPYLDAGYGFARGFDHYDDYSAVRISAWATHRARTSPALVDVTGRWLDAWHGRAERRPFFVFVHMWDVHYDFNPPPPYDTMFDPDYRGTITTEDFQTGTAVHLGMDPRDLEHVIALYDGEIRYTDEWLGRLIDRLRGLGVLDDTIVAVTSDHGEEFFEHGRKGHHQTLYDESIRVPLVLRNPARVPAGSVIPNLVRLVDVAPSLLDLTATPAPPGFGLDPSLKPYAGQSFEPLLTTARPVLPLPAFASLEPQGSKAVRSEDRKLLVSPWSLPHDELFDLASDPGERTNLAASDPTTTAALHAMLAGWKDTAAVAAKAADAATMDENHKAALRALGYLQ
ncbi:MAG: sulfatase [Candidatus Binatia bacterium]